MAGASITIKESYDGTLADSLGTYRFTTTETGTPILVVTATGYNTVERSITGSGELPPVGFQL